MRTHSKRSTWKEIPNHRQLRRWSCHLFESGWKVNRSVSLNTSWGYLDRLDLTSDDVDVHRVPILFVGVVNALLKPECSSIHFEQLILLLPRLFHVFFTCQPVLFRPPLDHAWPCGCEFQLHDRFHCLLCGLAFCTSFFHNAKGFFHHCSLSAS